MLQDSPKLGSAFERGRGHHRRDRYHRTEGQHATIRSQPGNVAGREVFKRSWPTPSEPMKVMRAIPGSRSLRRSHSAGPTRTCRSDTWPILPLVHQGSTISYRIPCAPTTSIQRAHAPKVRVTDDRIDAAMGRPLENRPVRFDRGEVHPPSWVVIISCPTTHLDNAELHAHRDHPRSHCDGPEQEVPTGMFAQVEGPDHSVGAFHDQRAETGSTRRVAVASPGSPRELRGRVPTALYAAPRTLSVRGSTPGSRGSSP